MTKVKDEEGEVHVELTAEEARQDRLGKPALSVLSPCLAAGVVAFGLTWLLIA